MKTKKLKVFYIDDQKTFTVVVEKTLENSKGKLPVSFQVTSFCKPALLKKALIENVPDILLLDVNLGPKEPTGIELASQFRKKYPNLVIVIYTYYQDESTIAAGVRAGCDQFINKSYSTDTLPSNLFNSYVIANMKRASNLDSNTQASPGTAKKSPLPYSIPVFAGSTLIDVGSKISNILSSPVESIHITGERGTGKTLSAAIFQSFLPPETPVQILDCNEIPPNMIHERLFGKIASSPADPGISGILEKTVNGWIILESVDSLPLAVQGHLIRGLENRKILSTSSQNLSELVHCGKFREDLAIRLTQSLFELPPLKIRGQEEVREILSHLVNTCENGPYSFAPDLLKSLCRYDWGDQNVNEMKSTIQFMTRFCGNDRVLTLQALPRTLWEKIESSVRPNGISIFQQQQTDPFARTDLSLTLDLSAGMNFRDLSQSLFKLLVERLQDKLPNKKLKKTEIGSALGMDRNTVARMMARMPRNLTGTQIRRHS